MLTNYLLCDLMKLRACFEESNNTSLSCYDQNERVINCSCNFRQITTITQRVCSIRKCDGYNFRLFVNSFAAKTAIKLHKGYPAETTYWIL